MICVSTRGAAPPTSFLDATLAGVAGDGGLYVPQTWPVFTREDMAAFARAPYAEVAAKVLDRFTGADLEDGVIADLCSEAYATFDDPAVTPVTELTPGVFLLELFHGPSLAFKDIAMQLLARLQDHVLEKRGGDLTVVCATSGDTGGAAVEALRGRANVRLVVLFPKGRISPVQRRFMTTASEDNVRALAVEGDFDDCQAILKALFADVSFARETSLAAVNSINLARVAAQTVYYFVAAAALGGRIANFAVPTGNLGDAFAGHAARMMGLPMGDLILATNANDIVARALSSGSYARGRARPTSSPAMDIQVASNFERLYFEASGRDGEGTARAFAAFARDGAIEIPAPVLATTRATATAYAVDEDRTLSTMRETFDRTGRFIDPHTAVALAAAADGRAGQPAVVLATAHPAKFPEAVRAATGREPPVPPAAVRVMALPERYDTAPASAEAVKSFVREAF